MKLADVCPCCGGDSGRSNIQAGIARALFEQAEYIYAPLPK